MPRIKQFDEKAILEKAMCLFWKKGYYATSIQDLVGHLGINRASLYDTYGGKKNLFELTFSHYQERNIKSVRQFLATQDDVRVGLERLFQLAVQQSIEDHDRKGCFVVNTTIEFIPNEQEFAALISNNKEKFESIFQGYLSQGVGKGQVSVDKNIPAISALLFTFYNGLKVITKVSFDQETMHQSIKTLLHVLD